MAKQLKYKIAELLSDNTADERTRKKKELIALCNVTERTFRTWTYRRINDGTEIPARAQIIIAQYFGVSANELYNEPVKMTSNEV